MSTGIEARDAGWQKVLENCPVGYRDFAHAAIDYLITLGEPFTADDIHRLIPDGVEPHSPNVVPALLGSRAKNGLIVPIGRYRTTRRTRHSSKNQVWKAAS